VRDRDGDLAIAKFPRRDDEYNTMLWEAGSPALAAWAGISVPGARVETVAGGPVPVLRRFDRDGVRRIPFLSLMSMLGARDNETRSFLEIVDALWCRVVFNILTSNADDHLRNHGFLYAGIGAGGCRRLTT
jgi:serine/threonine-protein kinase HipA